MNDNEYRPQSTDAMFARICATLDELKTDVKEIKGAQSLDAERVASLEREKWFNRGAAATIGIVAGGVWSWFTNGSSK